MPHYRYMHADLCLTHKAAFAYSSMVRYLCCMLFFHPEG